MSAIVSIAASEGIMSQRWSSLGAALVVAVLLTTVRTYAMLPSAIIIYGGALREPIKIAVLASPDPYGFVSLGCLDQHVQHTLPSLEIRPSEKRQYLNIAAFWTGYEELNDPAKRDEALRKLKPQDASQHGRLYLPANGESGFVLTVGHLMKPAIPHPIPSDNSAFTVGCWLTPKDVTTLQALNVPGF
jgi:hypothetical protein